MKKTAILLAIALVIGIPLGVYAAGAEKVDFTWDTDTDPATVDDGIHAEAHAFLIINKTPEGTTDVVIQIQLRDAAPNWEYAVYSGSILLGTFTTNKKGHGHLHCNLPLEDTLGAAVNIWNGVKPATRLLRAFL